MTRRRLRWLTGRLTRGSRTRLACRYTCRLGYNTNDFYSTSCWHACARSCSGYRSITGCVRILHRLYDSKEYNANDEQRLEFLRCDVATDIYLGDNWHSGLGSENRGIQHCRQSSGSDNGRQHGRQILKLQHLDASERISRYAYTVSTSDIDFIAMKIYANFE